MTAAATLTGAGSITGCPAPIGVESVTITVALQHLSGDTWADQASTTVTGTGSA